MKGIPAWRLNRSRLGDGAKYSFREASSLPEMEQKMAYQNLGLVLPADFDQTLASGGTPTLSGYIFWVDRMKVAELEAKYSQAFSEILGQPVQVVIGQNIIIPQADADGMQTTVTYLMVYFVFSTALLLIPHLMLEEKQTKTLDALLTSPASPGQVVLGKALAGFFYILVIGGLGNGPVLSVYRKLGPGTGSLPGICPAGHRVGAGGRQFYQIHETIGALDGGADPLPGDPAALLHGTKPESRHPDGPDLVPIFGAGQPLPLLVLHGCYSGAVPAEPCDCCSEYRGWSLAWSSGKYAGLTVRCGLTAFASGENLRCQIKHRHTIGDNLNIIWTIASKDIVDALKNRVVVSMIIMLSIMLLVPKMLPLIFEQPQTVLPVYDMGDSPLVAELKNNPDISVQKLRSEQELHTALCGAVYPADRPAYPGGFRPGCGGWRSRLNSRVMYAGANAIRFRNCSRNSKKCSRSRWAGR